MLISYIVCVKLGISRKTSSYPTPVLNFSLYEAIAMEGDKRDKHTEKYLLHNTVLFQVSS